MTAPHKSVVNIALVGGGELCREILDKTYFDYLEEGVDAPILAVVDSEPHSAGVVRAKELGLLTFRNYRRLYDPRYNIHLIIILTPDQQLFDEILRRELFIATNDRSELRHFI